MKAGTKEYYSQYYQQNKERHNATMKEWQQKENYSTSESVKKWQENNIDKVREWHRLKKRKQIKERRIFMDEYKSTCNCQKCGDNRPYVLDFHHLTPSAKSFDLGDASKHGIEKLKEELKKCITLCRNCHSEFHYIEKDKGIDIIAYLK
jgi:Zn finger protein HypA/HybF involved in hydrogenase expression